jgi:hypothetical protein
MTIATGWMWQLATTRKRHYFDGHKSLCGKADQRTDAKRWSLCVPLSSPRPGACCALCLREVKGSA